MAFRGQRIVRNRSGRGPSGLLVLHSKLSSGSETLVAIEGNPATTMISAISLFLALLYFRYWVPETAVIELRQEGLESISHAEWREKSAGGGGKRR